jgi:putative DNA primase/helicase
MSARRETTKERAHRQWRYILPHLGIAARFLDGHNRPCPMCGGKDRFRFIDKKDGDGMWVCNQCQPHPRPAIDLAIRFTGKPFREAARLVDQILGGTEPLPNPRRPLVTATTGTTNLTWVRRVWKCGVPVRRGDPVDRYLTWRGVGMDIYPPVLRCSALDWHKDDVTGALTRWPAMFALVQAANGKPVAVHRTFLAMDGSGKAPVAKPRKAAGRYGSTPTIRLTPPGLVMGIAEGIETALAASVLFKVPTWSVICANGIRNFEPPPECKHLIVFADHDAHGTGQRAADELTKRLRDSLMVQIRLPEHQGDDWNDVLLERER